MDHSHLTANQLVSQSQANSHRYDLFKALLGSSKAVPLDRNGTFSLIKTDKYRETLSTMEECQQIKEKLQQKCYYLNLNNIQIQKEVELLRNELAKFKQNELKLEQYIETITSQLRKCQQKIIDQDCELKKATLQFQSQSISSQSKKQIQRPTVLTKTATVQTEWTPEQFQDIRERPLQNRDSCDIISVEERLYSLLKQNTESFQTKMKEKLTQLHEKEASLEQWLKEKEEYKAQNQKLKQLLAERNLEDQKLKIWQQSISNMVDKMQGSINKDPAHLEVENSQKWKKQAFQEGIRAELNLKLRQAQQIMSVEQPQNKEEGQVVALVKMTQKVKELVKIMLAYINFK